MRIALAGNPNCGKTTLFNALTKSAAHVGNYPGITVERRTGFYKTEGDKIEIIDLPGIYSLSPYSPEEVISRTEIVDNDPDVIINIVDATNLERNLYLTTQILEADKPVVIALNFMDIIHKRGMTVDIDKLSAELGVPVVPVSAFRKRGLPELMSAALAAAATPRLGRTPIEGTYLDAMYKKALKMCKSQDIASPVYHAVKAVEADLVEAEAHPDILGELKEDRKAVINDFEGDFEGMVADLRYAYIDTFIHKVLKGRKTKDRDTVSDKVDRVLTHKIWGIPIFIAVMYLVFRLTFAENLFYASWTPSHDGNFATDIFGYGKIHSPGVILFNLLDAGTGAITELITGAMKVAPAWSSGLIVDALLGGVFAVLSFVPQILLLFLFISILEDTGYMSRVAFIVDRILRRFGLSGRAIMPIITCFGCAVPGIMATRTLANENERRMTIMLAPFFSCGAKLPIWAAFGMALGGIHSSLAVFAMYLLGIAVAVLSMFILKKSIFKDPPAPFIMELPDYHRPQFGNTMWNLWDKLKHYLIRAATVIAASTVVIWFLSSFSWAFWRGVVTPGESILASVAVAFQSLFYTVGFGLGSNGWMFVVAAFTGLIAKEMVISTLGVFAGLDADGLDIEDSAGMAETGFGPFLAAMGAPAAYAFMAFNLLSVPCMAAVAAARSELHSARKLWIAIGFWMATAYLTSAVVYWFGSLVAMKWWYSLIVLGLLAAGIGLFIGLRYRKNRLNKINAANLPPGL